MAKPKKSKRFKYNLEKVLHYRGIKEKQEQDKFAKAEEKFKEEREKEVELKDFQQEKYSELRESMSGGHTLDFANLNMRRAHLENLKEKVTEQEKVREEAEEKKDEQREVLIGAVKDRKILDKDKEKKNVQWKDIMKKEETKFLDDVATIGYDRNRRETKRIKEEKEERDSNRD